MTTYVAGGVSSTLNESRWFFFGLTLTLLWITVIANVRGLGVGKWVNNAGGVGALVIGGTLMILAATVAVEHRGLVRWRDLTSSGHGFPPFSVLGVLCLALVGMELGPIMGDEVRDPRRIIPRSVAWGGGLCALMYAGCTLSLLIAVPQSEMPWCKVCYRR